MSKPSSLVGRLNYFAEHHPAHDAVVSTSVTLSYAQLAQLVLTQVAQLENEGVSATSVVGIKCADDLQHLLLSLAATHIGATSCSIPSHETEQAQASLSKRCGVSHLLDASMAVSIQTLGACPATVVELAQSAAILFSTSGTTGEPKLVVHHDCDLVSQAHRHVSSQAERFACVASMEHNFAKRHRLYVAAAGATNVLIESGESLVSQCVSLAANVLHVSAFQAQELMALPDISQLSDIRLKLGGGHVPLELRRQLKENITKDLQAGYGTTETGAIGFTDPNDADSGESVGRPLPGIEVRVVSPERAPLAIGERGELAIHGEGMFREYLGKPDVTAERLHDGWFYTGDIGYVDDQQRIHLCGRSDDMFVFNSINIYPQDIESTILQHPSIVDAAVIPKASPVHGNIPVALLVFKEGVKQRLPEVEKFVQKQAGMRSPRQYIIVPEIPKTASGKISRSQAENLPSQSGEIRSDIFGMLSERSVEHLKPSLIDAFKNGDQDIMLRDVEMDSLDRMNFLVSIELAYDTVVTPKEFRRFRYLGNVVAHILMSTSEAENVSSPGQNGTGALVPQTDDVPDIVRLFRRTFRYCGTVAQLNKALTTLESRLTPLDIANLHRHHCDNQVLPVTAAAKFRLALSSWLQEMQDAFGQSGKQRLEPYVLRRVKPNICLFTTPGSASDKRLLICFPPREIRQLGIANAIFLQHLDATKFDVLMVSGPFATGYRLGRSRFDEELSVFRDWLQQQDWFRSYKGVRTLGFSAGARAAIGVGNLLAAELAVTVSGRFHRKTYVLENLDQLLVVWKTALRQPNTPVLLSYTQDNSRDKWFANVFAKITGGNKLEIEHEHEKLRHLVFQQLLEHGALANYLGHTILSEPNDKRDEKAVTDFVVSYPSGNTRSI